MANKLNKNQELLESFSKYMAENPNQRFWQALRNWSGHDFLIEIEGTFTDIFSIDPNTKIRDTFWLNDEDEIQRIKEHLDARKVQRSNPVSAD